MSLLKRITDLFEEEIFTFWNCENGDYSPDTKLVNDLGFDEMDLYDAIGALENEFSILIPHADAEAWVMVSDIEAYLKARPELKDKEWNISTTQT